MGKMRLDWDAEQVAVVAERAAWQAEREDNTDAASRNIVEAFGIVVNRVPLLRCDICGRGTNLRRSEQQEFG